MLHHLDKQNTKGAKALDTAQKHVGIPCKRRITPVKPHFAYLVHSVQSLIKNKGSVNYLYGLMENILDKIRKQKPSLLDW